MFFKIIKKNLTAEIRSFDTFHFHVKMLTTSQHKLQILAPNHRRLTLKHWHTHTPLCLHCIINKFQQQPASVNTHHHHCSEKALSFDWLCFLSRLFFFLIWVFYLLLAAREECWQQLGLIYGSGWKAQVGGKQEHSTNMKIAPCHYNESAYMWLLRAGRGMCQCLHCDGKQPVRTWLCHTVGVTFTRHSSIQEVKKNVWKLPKSPNGPFSCWNSG